MKKYIILLIPFVVACSFQVKESADENERLSKRPVLEEKDIYSEVDIKSRELKPYNYENTIPRVDYEVEEKTRFSRKSYFFDDLMNNSIDQKDYSQDEFYKKDESNYEVEEGQEFIDKNESKGTELKLNNF